MILSGIQLISPLALLLTVALGQHDGEEYNGLDMLKAEYQSGSTYAQRIEMERTTQMMFAGHQYDQVVYTRVDDEMTVSSSERKGKQMDFLFTRVGMKMDSLGQTIEFDSSNPGETDAFVFNPLQGLVDKHLTLWVDEENNVVETSDFGSAMEHFERSGNEAAHDLASPKRFEELARMTEALPRVPVQPGDSWDVNIELDEDIILQGTAELNGYTDHDGHRCAVVSVEGTFDGKPTVDSPPVLQSNHLSLSIKSRTSERGYITWTMYFDNENGFIRYSELTQKMTVAMTSPLDKKTTIEVPTQQVLTVNVELKK